MYKSEQMLFLEILVVSGALLIISPLLIKNQNPCFQISQLPAPESTLRWGNGKSSLIFPGIQGKFILVPHEKHEGKETCWAYRSDPAFSVGIIYWFWGCSERGVGWGVGPKEKAWNNSDPGVFCRLEISCYAFVRSEQRWHSGLVPPTSPRAGNHLP